MDEFSLTISNLRTEYLIDPIGIGVHRPRHSWTLESRARGMVQAAWRIVASSTGQLLDMRQGDLWDSGWVESPKTSQIEYAGAPIQARQRVQWAVQVRDGDGNHSAWSAPASWETGLLPDTDIIGPTASERSHWEAKWIFLPGLTPDRSIAKAQAWDGLVPAPHFRRAFTTTQHLVRARLYATSRGVYEARLNGEPVGDHTLVPGWTDYNQRIQYQTFDVTDLIRVGENVMGAIVAPGWYAGYVGFGPQCRHYGATPHLLMELHLDYADGSHEIVTTDDSWQASTHWCRQIRRFAHGPVHRCSTRAFRMGRSRIRDG